MTVLDVVAEIMPKARAGRPKGWRSAAKPEVAAAIARNSAFQESVVLEAANQAANQAAAQAEAKSSYSRRYGDEHTFVVMALVVATVEPSRSEGFGPLPGVCTQAAAFVEYYGRISMGATRHRDGYNASSCTIRRWTFLARPT